MLLGRSGLGFGGAGDACCRVGGWHEVRVEVGRGESGERLAVWSAERIIVCFRIVCALIYVRE